jgi:hypothetical protein
MNNIITMMVFCGDPDMMICLVRIRTYSPSDNSKLKGLRTVKNMGMKREGDVMQASCS